jgi:hypothetical protein
MWQTLAHEAQSSKRYRVEGKGSSLNGWLQAGFAILGGVIAGVVGVVLFLYEHRRQRQDEKDDRQQDALAELAALLLPLLVELERPLEGRGYWVDQVRELRRLGTWIPDSAENAQKGPDWDHIAEVAQQVERRWWGYLQVRISDPQMKDLREEFYDRSLHAAMSTAQPRVAATRLCECVEETLDRIGELIGTDLSIAKDRPPRPAAPESRNLNRLG